MIILIMSRYACCLLANFRDLVLSEMKPITGSVTGLVCNFTGAKGLKPWAGGFACSEDVINKIIAIIRQKFIQEKKLICSDAVNESEINNLEFYYQTKWKSIKNEEDNIRIMGMQTTGKLYYRDQNIFKRIFYRSIRKGLLSCLYLTNGQEIIIVKKGRDYMRRADYSYAITYLPCNRITNISIKESEYTSELKKIIVGIGNAHIDLYFLEGNKYAQKVYTELNALNAS